MTANIIMINPQAPSSRCRAVKVKAVSLDDGEKPTKDPPAALLPYADPGRGCFVSLTKSRIPVSLPLVPASLRGDEEELSREIARDQPSGEGGVDGSLRPDS
jgi:hypothetical protein